MCPKGKFTAQVQASACQGCSKGYYIPESADNLDHEHDDEVDCKACPEGFYNNFVGKEMCFECRTATGTASPTCSLCNAGQYTDSNAQEGCSKCPKGQFQSVAGENNCILCTPGHFAASTGSATCKACERGRYTHETGADATGSCRACPAGMYSVFEENCRVAVPSVFPWV